MVQPLKEEMDLLEELLSNQGEVYRPIRARPSRVKSPKINRSLNWHLDTDV
jgi:hypothetical protein